MTTPEKTTIFVDASSLKKISCGLRFYRNNLEGLRLKAAHNYKMAYGTAFHKFLQNYYNEVLPVEDCIQIALDYFTPHAASLPEDAWHTGTHLRKSLESYAQTYPRGGDGIEAAKDTEGKPKTECKFALPFWNNATHQIILSGTIDLDGFYYGTSCLIDHKTTSSLPQFAKSFFEGYDMDIQTMFYAWIAKTFLGHADWPAILINGIFLKRQTQKAAKLDVFDGVSLERSGLITYTDEQMSRFESWLMRKFEEIKTMLNQQPPPEYSACKQSFGLCEYWKLCRAASDLEADLKAMHYEKSLYNPLTFQD